MMCPYSKTVDGFEMQFGVNHLGKLYCSDIFYIYIYTYIFPECCSFKAPKNYIK